MKCTIINRFVCLLLLVLCYAQDVFSCSTYKVTASGKMMYGMNYDAWFTKPRIWFETKGYGAAFTGANYQERNDLTPQAGMNEFGLSFGTLATATPPDGQSSPEKKQIVNRAAYLKDILHTCKTVEDVRTYIEQYDHSTLANDVFMYTDKSGKFLVVEPYTMKLDRENKYVLANFCPSTVTDLSTIRQQRYTKGAAFLKDKLDSGLPFCRALSDTMHVCRSKIGDGTLLTSIWNLNDGMVSLYFYHDYDHEVTFNIKEELSKGDHSFEIPDLFPPNAEYQKLLHFKTPINSSAINWIILICFLLFAISAPYFLIDYLRTRNSAYGPYKLLPAILALCMAYYLLVLRSEIAIFYAPSPYKSAQFRMIDVASYLPFLLILLIVPLLLINRKVLQKVAWGKLSTAIFTLNNLAYLLLVALFFYWGFYDVFHA